MIRFRKYLPHLVTALVGAATLVPPSQARADFSVSVYDDGNYAGGVRYNSTLNTVTNFGSFAGLPFPITNGNSLVFAGSTAHFSVSNGSGLSNNTGAQGGSNLSLSGSGGQVSTTFGAAGGTHTLTIVLSENGWLAPTGTPLTLSTSGGGSIAYVGGTISGATESVSSTIQGFLDNSNALYPGNPLFGAPGGAGTPLQNASASLTTAGTAPLVYAPPTSVNNLVPGGTPFSMTDVLTLTFALGAGSGQDSATSSFSTVATVPAPAGLVLALTGVPFLGIGTWLRRRRQAV